MTDEAHDPIDNPMLLAITKLDTAREMEEIANEMSVTMDQMEQFVEAMTDVFSDTMAEPPPDESGARTFEKHLEGALGGMMVAVFEAGFRWRGALEGID